MSAAICGVIGAVTQTQAGPLAADPHMAALMRATLAITPFRLKPTPGLNPTPPRSFADWFEPDKLPKAIAFPNHIVSVLRAWQKAFLDGAIVSSLPDRPLSARGR
jgi:hypothetical protein